jgi:hypothetical protein
VRDIRDRSILGTTISGHRTIEPQGRNKKEVGSICNSLESTYTTVEVVRLH